MAVTLNIQAQVVASGGPGTSPPPVPPAPPNNPTNPPRNHPNTQGQGTGNPPNPPPPNPNPVPPNPPPPPNNKHKPAVSPSPGLPPILPVISRFNVVTAIATEAFEKLTGAVKATDQAFIQMSREAAQYNASVGIAEGIAELRETLSQMRRARNLGDELTEFTNVRGEIDSLIQDIVTDLSKQILPFIVDGLRDIAAILRILEEVLPDGGVIPKALNPLKMFLEVINPVKFTYGRIVEFINWKMSLEESKLDDKLLDEFKRSMDAFMVGNDLMAARNAVDPGGMDNPPNKNAPRPEKGFP